VYIHRKETAVFFSFHSVTFNTHLAWTQPEECPRGPAGGGTPVRGYIFMKHGMRVQCAASYRVC